MEYAAAVGEAFGLGLWTSLSPCPLATNIAAVSFLGRRVDSSRHVLAGGLLYALGRAVTYVVLAVLAVGGARATGLAEFLETRMFQLLGPVLILVAMFLLELLRFNVSVGGPGERGQKLAERGGPGAAFLLGVLFALSFCPVSAGFFFVALLRMLTSPVASIVLPALYGLGTALPVVVFAVLLVFGAQAVGKAFNVLAPIERWLRRVAGMVFLGVGIYFSLRYCFGLF